MSLHQFGPELAGDLLPDLRVMAESRMLSTATIRRKTGETVWNGRAEVPEWADVHAGIPFRLGGSPRNASRSHTVDAGGVEVEVAGRTGHLPYGTDDLMDGDLIDVAAGENAGLVFEVVEATLADQQTAVRVPIVAVRRPTEWG